MSRSRRRQQASQFCGRLGEDDGIDPRTYFDNRNRARDDRKARQLCKQVSRTLDLVLGGELGDDLLRDLMVESVDPAPNAGRLLVVLEPTIDRDTYDVPAALERLAEYRGRLRSEIARSIHRRKVPELVFQIRGPISHPEDER